MLNAVCCNLAQRKQEGFYRKYEDFCKRPAPGVDKVGHNLEQQNDCGPTDYFVPDL